MKDNLRYNYLILIILAISIFCLSFINYWIGDEIAHRFYSYGSNDLMLTSVADAFNNQIHRYLVNDGRLFAHFIVQLNLCVSGKFLFSVLNSLFFVFFILGIAKICRVNIYKKSILSIVILVLLTYIIVYAPTECVQYVWINTFVLYWLILFFSKSSHSTLFNVISLPISFLIGSGHEGIGIGVFVALILYIVRNRTVVSRTQVLMAMSFCLGVLFCCFSPASMQRASSFRSVAFTTSFISVFLYLKASYVAIIVIVYKLLKKEITFISLYKENSFYIDAFIVLLCFNLYVGVYCNRQLLGMELMSIVLIIKLLEDNSMSNLWNTILLIVVVVSYSYYLDIMVYRKNVYNNIEKLYCESSNGVVFYDLDGKCMNPSYSLCVNLKDWELYSIYLWHNYYNKSLKPIKVLPKCIENIETIKSDNFRIKKIDNKVMVIAKNINNEKKLMVSRSIEILKLQIPYKPLIIYPKDYKVVNDKCAYTIVDGSYSPVPFIVNNGVEVID